MPQPEPAEKSPLAQASVGETGASCLDRTAMSASGVTPQLQHCVPTIPDHELIRRIGSGSYGEVWLARSVMGTFRAVKIVYRKSFDHGRPFEREFKGIQKFEPISRSHDGLVDILQIGRNDQAGYFYYVMELADDANAECGVRNAECTFSNSRGAGIANSEFRSPHSYAPRTLQSDLKTRGRLSPEECIPLALALTRALGYLHEQGLVHRDIKPSNIIFVKGAAKLADIGLVSGTDTTQCYVGREGFIPPEGPGTPQADIYSLGKVFYEMSTGKDRQDFPDLPTELRDEGVRREGLLEFNEVLVKACARKLSERYQAAQEMEIDLALLQSGKSIKQQWAARRWRTVAKIAGVIGAIAALLFAALPLLKR